MVVHGPPGRTVQYLDMNEGGYVIRSVSIQITNNFKRSELYNRAGDFSKLTEKKQTDLFNSSYYHKTYNLGNIFPNTVKTIESYVLDENQNEIDLFIKIFAENGVFTERIKQIDLWGKMKSAVEIRDSNYKIIHESVDKYFPRNEDGTVKW